MNFLHAQAAFEQGRTVLRGTGFDITLPPERSKDTITGPVQIGVRPEDLDACEEEYNTLQLRISVKEHLGHTVLVYGYVDEVQVVASLDPHCQVELESEIHLAVNTDTLHVFGLETGQTLL